MKEFVSKRAIDELELELLHCLEENMEWHSELEKACCCDHDDIMFYITIGRVQAFAHALSRVQQILKK